MAKEKGRRGIEGRMRGRGGKCGESGRDRKRKGERTRRKQTDRHQIGQIRTHNRSTTKDTNGRTYRAVSFLSQ